MASFTAEFTTIDGTAAALGRAGAHSLVADRPAGRAGGLGLGFNGAQLLALAVGGCLANDLRYVAEASGIAIGRIAVKVTIEADGTPLLATGVDVEIACEATDGSDPAALVAATTAITMVGGTLAKGIPVAFRPVPRAWD